MALETLKNKETIGSFSVLQERVKKEDGSIDWDATDEARKKAPIFVDHDVNMISFRIQNGPVKENGVNGCQVDTLIHTAREIIVGLNRNHKSSFNDLAIKFLDSAINTLDDRTRDREKRGVEGTSKS